MSEIQLRKIHKSFGPVEVLHDVSIEAAEGEFVVFVGPSGCGKSTLLRVIAGLEEITSGELRIGGDVVNGWTPRERGIAMVFQSYALYPHMTVYKNMAFGLKLGRKGKSEIERRVREAARILQLEEYLDRRPAQLSGGQRQRVAIGRAIVRKPRVFLFDEPLSNLDAALRVQTRLEIAKLHRRLGATMIYVTHDQVEAMTLADRIVVLNAGRVEQVGTPLELYSRPCNLFVAGFIGSPKMNFLRGRVEAVREEGVDVVLADGQRITLARSASRASAGDDVTVGVRPEHLSPVRQGGLIRGEVDVVERLGDVSYTYFTLADSTRVIASTPGISDVEEGEIMTFAADPSDVHLFDAQGLFL